MRANRLLVRMLLLVAFASLLSSVSGLTNAAPPSASRISTSSTLPHTQPHTTQPQATHGLTPRIVRPNRQAVSPALRSISIPPQRPAPNQPAIEIPRFNRYGDNSKLAKGTQPADRDTAVQEQLGPQAMPTPVFNFEGVSALDNGVGLLPPDTNGDIGPNHYVQWVNISYQVWEIDRTTTTATPVFDTPLPGNAIFASLSGPCSTTNDGDPIVLYDTLADRWFMSQFAFPNFPSGPFIQCIAVSQTGDPTGAFNLYEYTISETKLNDYPHFGVWPDGYYMTVNQFEAPSFNWGGAGVAAFERDEMLTGGPARMVYFDLASTNINFGGMLPADLDGPVPPPAGTPNYFMEADDSAFFPNLDSDRLALWEFHVDWNDLANSTFGQAGDPTATMPTEPFDFDMCGFSRNCIPQPSGSPLDAISDRLMYRLAYRNFGTHESLVLNHTVDAEGTDRAGVRWYEVRDPGSDAFIYQQGTMAPTSDAHHRWMGSIAQDHHGNIALGYSLSSFTQAPSIVYTGRLSGDLPLGEMSQGEEALIMGTGSQGSFSGRWGDYSMMGIDPLDDCTFWFTSEYYSADSDANWQTRIGSFKFPSCSIGPQGTITGTVHAAGDPTATITGARVQASASATLTLGTSTNEQGLYTLIAPVGTYTVTGSAYGYLPNQITGVEVISGTTITLDIPLDPAPLYVISGTITDDATGWPLFARIDIVGYPFGPVWSDPTTGFYSVTLAGGQDYIFNVHAWVQGYESGNATVSALASNQTLHIGLHADHDICTAPGYTQSYVFFEDFEQDNGNFTVSGQSPSWDWGEPTSGPGEAASGLNVWATNLYGFYNDGESSALTSPNIDLSAHTGKNIIVSWKQWLSTESGYDYVSVEVSNNGGATWTPVYGPFSGPIDLSWARQEVVLNDAYAVSNFQIRFTLGTDFSVVYPGYYIDDVGVSVVTPPTTTLPCLPPVGGGLFVGNVYDENTLAPTNNALVSSDKGTLTYSGATPGANDGVDDGFYTLYAPSGGQSLSAVTLGFVAIPVNVTISDDQVISQALHVGAGFLDTLPEAWSATAVAGTSTTLPFSLTNEGRVDLTFSTYEINVPLTMPTHGPFAKLGRRVGPRRLSDTNSEGVRMRQPPAVPPLAAGDVIQTWPTNLVFPWGIGYNIIADDLWIGSIAVVGGDDLDHRFLRNGTDTGDTIDVAPHIEVFAADMTYDSVRGTLWQVNVGGDNCIFELDPASQTVTGNRICPAFGTSQRGLAYDLTTDTFFSGSWNDAIIQRFDRAGDIIESVNTGLDIAGLAFNPVNGHLFVVSNTDVGFDVVVLDVNADYAPIGGFDIEGLNNFDQSGLEIDCQGHLWTVNQNSGMVIEAESGDEAACLLDIPWLETSPISGTLSAHGLQPIEAIFDATALRPGEYNAQLALANDTPYGSRRRPVTFTVTTPPTWGTLVGDVVGMDYCDSLPGTPLDTATIEIAGPDPATISTDAMGHYNWPLNQGTYTLTVSAPGYLSQVWPGIVVDASSTVPNDFALRPLLPCASTIEAGFEITVSHGSTATTTLTLVNDGVVSYTFDLTETHHNPITILGPIQVVDPAAPSTNDRRAPAHVGRTNINYHLSPDAIIWRQDFEEGLMPPSGWYSEATNSTTWESSSIAFQGDYAAHVLSSEAPQDEWLIGPDMVLDNGTLIVWSYGSVSRCASQTTDLCDAEVWLVVGNAGGDDDIFVGQLDDSWVSNYVWSPAFFDLDTLLPTEPVRIGIRYVGMDGAEVAIDEMALVGAPSAVDLPWLSTDPVSATVEGDSDTSVTLSLKATNADGITGPGTYTGFLRAYTSDAHSGSYGRHTIPVTLHVTSPTHIAQAIETGQQHTRMVSITNPDATPLPFTVSSDVPWATPSPISGTIDANGSFNLNVSFDATGLAPSQTPYQGSLTVRNLISNDVIVVLTLELTVNPVSCHNYNQTGLVDVHDILQITNRFMNASRYDVRYDVIAPYNEINILDIVAVASNWNLACS